MSRFATPEQIAEVAALSTNIAAYQAIMDGLVKEIAGFVEAYSPNSGLEIRTISSDGRDDEKWRGNLLAKSPGRQKVDIWLITQVNSGSVPLEELATGENARKYTLGLDFYLDYSFGTDANNSEADFLGKVRGFEAILDDKRTCFESGTVLDRWLFSYGIKRFTNASTHIAKGDLDFTIGEL